MMSLTDLERDLFANPLSLEEILAQMRAHIEALEPGVDTSPGTVVGGILVEMSKRIFDDWNRVRECVRG